MPRTGRFWIKRLTMLLERKEEARQLHESIDTFQREGAEAAEAESIIHGKCPQNQRSCCLPGPR